MFEKVHISSFGRHKQFDWQAHGCVNLIIGENDTGKSQLLKLLYSIVKSLELTTKRRQTTQTPWAELLAEKLMWTFQPDHFELGKLVTRGEGHKATINCHFCRDPLHFSFGQATTKQIKDCSLYADDFSHTNAVYIPPKEVFSAMDAIYASRKQLEVPGFDDCYIDLIEALRLPMTQGRIAKPLVKALNHLKVATGGGEIKKEQDEFVFTRGRERYGMRSVAEGIRKVGVFNQLIGNRTLRQGSVLFIDEPETNLHPRALVLMAEILYLIAQSGVQIYLATHSEFLIKRFEQLVRQENADGTVSLLSITQDQQRNLQYQVSDLLEGIPDNPILAQSLDLYHKDVELDLA